MKNFDNEKITQVTQELLKAKHNAQACLDDAMCLCDMHGLAYWAKVVEQKREELKNLM